MGNFCFLMSMCTYVYVYVSRARMCTRPCVISLADLFAGI